MWAYLKLMWVNTKIYGPIDMKCESCNTYFRGSMQKIHFNVLNVKNKCVSMIHSTSKRN